MSGFVFTEKPIRIERGNGASLYAHDGTEYLDFGASYACVPLGHCHPAVVTALQDQAERLNFVQASYPVDARTALYEQLAEGAPGDIDKVWLCNSGTEANEAALKFARHATGRRKLVAATRGFHGRTMGALAATWNQEYKEGFEPLAGGIEFVEYGNIDALAASVDSDTAGVILEPIQGEGGVNAADPAFVAAARERTAETGAALIVDEVQTGMGRTGTLWACERLDVVPDILTTAKGVANGLPMGATLCRDWVAENPGSHGGTFSGGPVVCAAAGATLDTLTGQDVPSHAAAMGDRLVESLTAELGDAVRDVRGQGLLVGVEVRREANAVIRELALEHRILALPAGRTVVRLLPPLVVDDEHVDRVVTALSETISAVE